MKKKKKKKKKKKSKMRIQFLKTMPKLTFCQHSTDAKMFKNAKNVTIFQVIWGVWPLVSPPPPIPRPLPTCLKLSCPLPT